MLRPSTSATVSIADSSRRARCARIERSLVFEIPPELSERFRYQAGQFLSFKVPHQGMVLTRSYSLASSPVVDPAPKVTIKRVDDGRISNWINDSVKAGDELYVVPPAAGPALP